jgi:hypothetical protein
MIGLFNGVMVILLVTHEDEQNINSDKLITKALAENPRRWFGTYELGQLAVDPRTQSQKI